VNLRKEIVWQYPVQTPTADQLNPNSAECSITTHPYFDENNNRLSSHARRSIVKTFTPAARWTGRLLSRLANGDTLLTDAATLAPSKSTPTTIVCNTPPTRTAQRRAPCDRRAAAQWDTLISDQFNNRVIRSAGQADYRQLRLPSGGGAIGNNVGYDFKARKGCIHVRCEVVGDYTGLTPRLTLRRLTGGRTRRGRGRVGYSGAVGHSSCSLSIP